jgi:hypothetical protein
VPAGIPQALPLLRLAKNPAGGWRKGISAERFEIHQAGIENEIHHGARVANVGADERIGHAFSGGVGPRPVLQPATRPDPNETVTVFEEVCYMTELERMEHLLRRIWNSRNAFISADPDDAALYRSLLDTVQQAVKSGEARVVWPPSA